MPSPYITSANLERALFDCLDANADASDLSDALTYATLLDPVACKFALMDCLTARQTKGKTR